MNFFKKILPKRLHLLLSNVRAKHRRSYIQAGNNSLINLESDKTFVMIVGSTYDERRPDAMLVARKGYCSAFSKMGISCVTLDIRDVEKTISNIKNPFCMLYSSDLEPLNSSTIKILRNIPLAIWVHPWFADSDTFFSKNSLDKSLWHTSRKIKDNILSLNPKFIFSATLDSGAEFFSEWERNGVPFYSFPLACDTSRYNETIMPSNIYKNIKLAFVGGYWSSKGVQIDSYLREFEDQLTVFGYNKWPYANYGGQIDDLEEPKLYASAAICPVINEPSVSLLHGQINERVFKVLGSGGFPIVDNVWQYRTLFNENELVISENKNDFKDKVNYFLKHPHEREKYIFNGRKAVFSRHTYLQRAELFLEKINI